MKVEGYPDEGMMGRVMKVEGYPDEGRVGSGGDEGRGDILMKVGWG